MGNYWKNNLKKGIHQASDWMGLRGFILDIIAGFIIARILNDNLIETVVIAFLVILGIFIAIALFFSFILAPYENHKEQEKIIAERIPGKLSLEIEKGPDTFTRDGKSGKVAALRIISKEQQKIVELQALVNFHHYQCKPDKKFVSEAGYEMFYPLLFGDGSETQDKIELRPNTPIVLYISEFGKFKTEKDEQVFIPMFGGSKVVYSAMFRDESIFQISIMFQGKLESEHNFRTTYYSTTVHTNSAEKKMRIIDLNRKYPDTEITKRLFERAKRGVEYLESDRKKMKDRG